MILQPFTHHKGRVPISIDVQKALKELMLFARQVESGYNIPEPCYFMTQRLTFQ